MLAASLPNPQKEKIAVTCGRCLRKNKRNGETERRSWCTTCPCSRYSFSIKDLTCQQALEISSLPEWESRLANERAQNSSISLRCENLEDELDQVKMKLRETTNKLALGMLLHKQLLLQLDMVLNLLANNNNNGSTGPTVDEVRRKNLELSRQVLESKHLIASLKDELEGLRLEKKYMKEQLQGIEERHSDEVRREQPNAPNSPFT